jgi:heme o synthase
LVVWPVAELGWIYVVTAVVLGAVFMLYAVRLYKDGTTKRAMQLFVYSNAYISLLFIAMAVDSLVIKAS